MLSRKTTLVLAELYDLIYGERRRTPLSWQDVLLAQARDGTYYHLKREALYDFLFEREYPAWFLNIIKGLPNRETQLKESIMRLHTGETVEAVTQRWTWEQRSELGQTLLTRLAKDMLVQTSDLGDAASADVARKASELGSLLELDGYLFCDGRLYYTEAAILDTEHEQGILEKLIGDLRLDNSEVMKHHLELSQTHYLEQKWDDSIGNSRKLLESVLQEAAARHHMVKTGQPIARSTYSRPAAVRDYICTAGLVERMEKETITKVYALLSGTGGHPYIAEKDQARLMRHLALTFAQFALLRLQGALKSA